MTLINPQNLFGIIEMIEAEQYQKNYHRFLHKNEKGNSLKQKFFLCSDIHYDNPKTKRKLFHSHMKQAVEEGAKIIIVGDLLCLMEGKYDKRSNKNILPENTGGNYLDLVINNTANDLLPYAENILLITQGNHETAVSNRHETYVLERLVERMNLLANTRIQVGAYDGYLTYAVDFYGSRCSLDIGYSHGRWGGVVTKGALGVSRYAAYMPDCDVHITGHTHDGFIMTYPRMKKNVSKKSVEVKKQWHVKLGTYKEEFSKGEGWATEKIGTPKHIGGAWMEAEFKRGKNTDVKIYLT